MRIVGQDKNAVNRVSETDTPTTDQEVSSAQCESVVRRAAALLASNPDMSRSEAIRRALDEIDEAEALLSKDGKLNVCIFPLADIDRLERISNIPLNLRNAARLLASLAQNPQRRFDDSFGEYSESVGDTTAAFRICRTALDFLEADFRAEEADNLKFMRLETAKPEAIAPKTPEERVADAYWTAMEQLNAAGLDFDALVSYHSQEDGKVKA